MAQNANARHKSDPPSGNPPDVERAVMDADGWAPILDLGKIVGYYCRLDCHRAEGGFCRITVTQARERGRSGLWVYAPTVGFAHAITATDPSEARAEAMGHFADYLRMAAMAAECSMKEIRAGNRSLRKGQKPNPVPA